MVGRTKNLLRNYCGRENMDYWEVVSSGGDGFTCEETPAGCKDFSEFCKIKEEVSCWATSHEPCVKFQLVYLPESGISTDKLDNKKPPITVRDWYTSRGDCGCEYTLMVRLLADDKETELDKFDFTDTLEAGADWKKVRHVFKDYPEGVRYVEFRHGGQDTSNWAGHFGVKMTNSAVFVGKKKKGQKKRDLKDASGKNLLNNACGQSGLDDWEVVSSGGDGWLVEEEAAATDPIQEAVPDAEGEWRIRTKLVANGPCHYLLCIKKKRECRESIHSVQKESVHASIFSKCIVVNFIYHRRSSPTYFYVTS